MSYNQVLKEFSTLINSRDGELLKLTMYADKLLRIYKVNGRAVTADDVVYEVVTKIAYGDRTWDPGKHPDLLNFIRIVMRSFIKNLTKDESAILKPGMDPDPERQEEIDIEFTFFIDRHSIEKVKNLEDILQAHDAARCCLEPFKDDCLFTSIIIMLSEGRQRKEIAKKLGLTYLQVRSAIMKIRRKLRPVVKDYRRNDKKKVRLPG